MNTILTDDERRAAIKSVRHGMFTEPVPDDVARAVEAAVLAKLAQQAPKFFYDEEDGLLFDPEETRPEEAYPLYTHPAPQQADRQRVPEGWTETSKAMPPSGQVVLACYKNEIGNTRRIRAQWVAAKTSEASIDSDCGEYDEATDTYYDPEGWYECIDNWDCYSSVFVSAQITHWMPLPAAPDAPDAAPEAPAQASAVDERAAFETWYSQSAFNFERDPIGSRDCGLQWKAWQARAALAQKGGAA